MALYFSISTDGFYDSETGIPVPEDAILLTEEQYHSFLYSLNNENKKLILQNNKLVLVTRETTSDWNFVRRKRNRLLRASDHKVTPDYHSDKEVWAQYRQQLRDITKLFTDPSQVKWPEPPSN